MVHACITVGKTKN